MEIRHPDGREDVRGLVESHGRAWQAAYRGIVPDEVLDGMTTDPDDEELDRWYDHYAPHGDRVLVADVGGSVRGYAFFRWGDQETKAFVGDDEAGLKEIYVHPDRWGEGIGTALLEAGLDRLPDGTTALKLETLAENDRGRAFYEARGFEVVGSTTTEIAGEEVEETIYSREL